MSSTIPKLLAKYDRLAGRGTHPSEESSWKSGGKATHGGEPLYVHHDAPHGRYTYNRYTKGLSYSKRSPSNKLGKRKHLGKCDSFKHARKVAGKHHNQYTPKGELQK